MSDSRPVRVRFAPSPTGDLHIGGVRTALFNWLMARRYGGKFILRVEDTDQKRTQEQSLTGIMDGLRWAGIDWDEGPDIGGPFAPYVQSERLHMYQEWAKWLVDQGKAYRAYETPEELEIIQAARKANGQQGYNRRARRLTPDDWAKLDAQGKPYVIRFKMPLEGETTVQDMVRGAIRVKNEDLADLILLKTDGFPTYHLANIVDDHFMEISHIIRAEEWIPTAPLHKQLYDAFGWEMPQIAHAPVILKINGKGKMSKRDEGASISYFMNGGYLPDAVTNFLCNVGWNYGEMDAEGKEIQVFTKEDAAKVFDLSRMTPTGTKFDLVKLQWLNGEYIRLMSVEDLAVKLRPILESAGYEVNVDTLLKIVPLVQERLKLLNSDEILGATAFFFKDEVTPTADSLIGKKMDSPGTIRALEATRTAIEGLTAFDHAAMEGVLRPLAEQLGLSNTQFFGVIRVAVTGQQVSPPLFETIEILGKETTLTRIDAALNVLRAAVQEQAT